MDLTGWALLVLLSVLWGGAYFFAGVAVREVPPLTLVFAHVLLAALILLPVFLLLGHSLPRTLAEWRPFVGMGLFNNVLPFSFIFAGQTFITVGLSSIINAMTPLFTVLVMAAFREEALTLNRIIGVLLGVAGVAVLQGVGPEIEARQSIGIALCLAGALSYGFAGLWGRRNLADVAPLKSATCQLMASSVMMGIAAAIIDRPWTLPPPSAAAIGAILALAALGTATAYIVFFAILVRSGASNVMLVTLLIPVTAILLGGTFLNETIAAREIVGALIIAAGLIVIDGRLPRRLLAKTKAAPK
jgi:drug/metabolite transporter (DMT)-like permease